ncbi:unnamed protein product [Lactuca saligna]|uniref:Leucine-rich repeat-containing N-terminal plant-type domain-containing protein n=1 Tax=Lactuca saligna TaxID=75948 RepID=A0AA35ZVI7_LACSI|nr:unnamed protein product [Lactuca saligna]
MPTLDCYTKVFSSLINMDFFGFSEIDNGGGLEFAVKVNIGYGYVEESVSDGDGSDDFGSGRVFDGVTVSEAEFLMWRVEMEKEKVSDRWLVVISKLSLVGSRRERGKGEAYTADSYGVRGENGVRLDPSIFCHGGGGGFKGSIWCLVNVACSQKERLALLKFKGSVEDTSGMLSSWVGEDCCLWERIHCDSLTGTIDSLNLRGEYYFGGEGGPSYSEGYLVGNEVNSSLAELRHLKYLDLSLNFYQGSRIPEFIGSFKQLMYLNLSTAGFQGIIPPHIGNLSNLKVLDLSSNYNLASDDMSWTFGLPSLEHLDLSYVDLGGAKNMGMVLYNLPSLKELSLRGCGLSNVHLGPFFNSSRILANIKRLDLGSNSFKGPLPGFCRNMTSLEFLDLSGFNLSLAWNFANVLNMIPSSLSELHFSSCWLDNKTFLSSAHFNISMLSNIQHLDLSWNSIEGIFPSVFSNMSSLRVLDLSRNMLHSSVPIMVNLLELDLSVNQFKNIEDVGIWRQCHLKTLAAYGNPFEIERIDPPQNVSECSQYALEWLDLSGWLNGTIPEAFGRLTNLRVLLLMNSSLTGPIPESLGRLRFLEVLDLHDNQLNGSIPESFGNLAALESLYLQSNHLTGPIPTSLGRLVSLQAIRLSSNLLNGTIPVSIGQLAKLNELDISDNSLEGVVSEAHFANLSMLEHLYASSNTKLTFNVSREWIPPFQLLYLDLSSCNLTNGLPQWLRNQFLLSEFVLSNASISGPLPTWLRKMPVIDFLDLSHNKLSGPLTNLPEIGWVLILANNIFNESIPKSLCRWTNLYLLDLSRNRLTGTIPKCLQDLQRLSVMIFSSNLLSGVIPSYIALSHSSLEWLKLNDNKFIGELPRELGNLRYLRVLDVGDNQLFGKIPHWIGENLTSLIVLRLHKNNFTGEIPESLCKMSKLQILDVAYNNLTGIIPHCLRELNAMVNGAEKWYVSYGWADSNENVIQVMKGVDLEYTRILDIVYNMDLSSNKLVGEIPVELTALSMLIGLNLSNNHLSGRIPENIGNMTRLESLDLSGNKLTGTIPPSMAALTFLSHLNLSHNNLWGRIPTGHQLQTLIDDPSIYAGNRDLCGPPLTNNCSDHQDPTTTAKPKKKHKAAEESIKVWWFYPDIMSGFATGFWGVIGVLLLKKRWRWRLFMFVEKIMDKIYVAVMVTVVAKIKRGREAV